MSTQPGVQLVWHVGVGLPTQVTSALKGAGGQIPPHAPHASILSYCSVAGLSQASSVTPLQSSSRPLQLSGLGAVPAQNKPAAPSHSQTPGQVPFLLVTSHASPAPTSSSVAPSQSSSSPLHFSAMGVGAEHGLQPLAGLHICWPRQVPKPLLWPHVWTPPPLAGVHEQLPLLGVHVLASPLPLATQS